jgi:hypothetical protein
MNYHVTNTDSPVDFPKQKYALFKLSSPGWTKIFDTELGLQQELCKYICSQCQAEEAITEHSEIKQMLSTDCGCEFDVGVI